MKNLAYFVVILTGTVLLLIYEQSMLIQFIIALLLWFATMQFKQLANKSYFFRTFVPEKLQSLLILTALVFIGYLVINTVLQNLFALISSFSLYENNIANVVSQVEGLLKIKVGEQMTAFFQTLDMKNILSSLAESLSGILSHTMMILIYMLFIFLEVDSFKLKMDALFPEAEKKEKFTLTLDKVQKSLSSYFRVKTLMSLLTAGASFLVLTIIGVDSAVLWAFLIFLLNYIPTIGSLVATLFPAAFSLLQFGRFTPFIIVLVSVGLIQQVVGNVIEPRLMGKSLNISPMVTIIALSVWGQLWGVMGMLLSVPITVIMIVILSQFESTQKVAILLSEKGELS